MIPNVDLSGLSEQEKAAVLKILEEYSKTGESKTLTNLE